MPINFTIGTWLVKVKVGGGGSKGIGTKNKLIKPIVSLTFVLSTLFRRI